MSCGAAVGQTPAANIGAAAASASTHVATADLLMRLIRPWRGGCPANQTCVISAAFGMAMVVLLACLYARAAAMNERNSGCGALGRERYSGWNWQPRNHGWSSSSTIST